MKQEIIEEMARIIAFDLCPNRSVHAKWGEEAQCYSDNNFAECTKIKNVVDKLYNAGYRKIPEGAVVLTEEELTERDYERYNLGYETHRQESQKREDYIETLSHHINDLENALLIVRKETAEKLLNKVDYESNGQTKAITDLLRKEYGVETK